jgi:hypothetical protein
VKDQSKPPPKKIEKEKKIRKENWIPLPGK